MADVGRPTVMTEETLQKLRDAFSIGATDIEACFCAEISPGTLYNYQEEHPEYLATKIALKEMVKYQARKNVANKIKGEDIDTSKWYLERKAREEFSTRQETDEKSQITHRVIIEDGDSNEAVETPQVSANNTEGQPSL